MVAALKTPEVVEFYKRQGLEPGGNSSEAFGTYLQVEIEKWKQLIKDRGIKSE
jgi:tripartite-type tricarboxylate transporter receptor subunit TctC